MEKKLLNRSARVQEPTLPEEFSVQDYHEARAFETVLDIIGDLHGFPIDGHSHPGDNELSDALSHLNFFIDHNAEQAIVELLSSMQGFCFKLSGGVFVGMSELERQSLSPDFTREESPQLKPFFQQVKYIASRFIVEKFDYYRTYSHYPMTINGYYLKAINECAELMQGMFEEVQSIYQHHIPAYNVVFDRFDELHEQDDDSLEVYLGRDGIHAYYGRIGQIAARGDVELAVSEIDAPSPERIVYLVYNRTIRDKIGSIDGYYQDEYLKQFISDDDSPHFFDTGFRGSIPEDIIKRLQLSGDMDERIHLIDVYNGYERRRVKGLDQNANGSVIEETPKSETSAGGLVHDEEDEIIRYTAKPSNLEDQLKFQIARTILLRHYWSKEHQRIKEQLGIS